MAVNDFVAKMNNPATCPIEYKVFEALMSLANTTVEEVTGAKRAEELEVRLETIEGAISNSIFKYWRTNKHLAVKFKFDHSRTDDTEPFNTGWVFSTRIKNERHKASVLLDMRSSGFVWFFSFLVWFYNVKQIYGEKLVILLDEPGLTLHGTAQQDLLRYFNEELRPYYQLIYTTHAPFMLDPENPFDLRGVEDVVHRKLIDNEIHEEVLGTKVTERIFTGDRDTLLPLEGIAGFAMAQSMFIGPNVFVVEGASEHAFIKWFSSALSAKGRVGCDLRWAIAPAESASKVSSFVTLFKGRKLRIAALMDYHHGQKQMVDNLAESKLLTDGWLLKTTQFVGKEEADIEDLLGWELYRHLVNKAMDLHQQIEITEDANAVGDRRLVKFVEDKFKVMPVGVPKFDHYKPAEYLLGVQPTECDNLPGIDEALDRFEALFKALNALLAEG